MKVKIIGVSVFIITYCFIIYIFGPFLVESDRQDHLKLKDLQGSEIEEYKKSSITILMLDEVSDFKSSACFFVNDEEKIRGLVNKLITAKPTGGDLTTVEDQMILKLNNKTYVFSFTHYNGWIIGTQDNSLGFALLDNPIDLKQMYKDASIYWLPVIVY